MHGQTKYSIRKYRATDLERLRLIAKETAWKSYKKSEKKLETVAIMYNDYFTKYESEHIFVAVDENDIPVGYVICSTNYEQFVQKNKEEFLPQAKTFYRPIAIVHNMLFLILKRLASERRVHLHIDLLPEAQHQGLGTQLLDALSDHLYRNGYPYLQVCGVSKSAGSFQFYKKYGFTVYKNHAFGRATLTINTRSKNDGEILL